MDPAANVAEAAAAPGGAGGLAGLLAGGAGGAGAPPAVPVILAPPVGKKLHPGLRHEVAQALIQLGLVLDLEAVDEQTACIIPLSIAQQKAIVDELVRVDWPGAEATPERFAERVRMWEGLNELNLRLIQLFAVEAIATNGKVPQADVTQHIRDCLGTLMDKLDMDIDARRKELLADRNMTDVVDALTAFLADKWQTNAAQIYKILCENPATHAGLLAMGLHVKTDDDLLQANYFSMALSKLVQIGLITENDCRMRATVTKDAWETNVDGKATFVMTVVQAMLAYHSGTPAQVLAAAPAMGKDRKLQGMKMSEGDTMLVLLDNEIGQALQLAQSSELTGIQVAEKILELLYKDFPTCVVKVMFLDAVHDFMRKSSTSTTTTTSSSTDIDTLTEDFIAAIAAGKGTSENQHKARLKALVSIIAAAIGAGLVGLLPVLPTGSVLVRTHQGPSEVLKQTCLGLMTDLILHLGRFQLDPQLSEYIIGGQQQQLSMYKYTQWMSAACDCLQHALRPIVLKFDNICPDPGVASISLKETFLALLAKFHRDEDLSSFGGVTDFHLAVINPIVNQWIGMYFEQMDMPKGRFPSNTLPAPKGIQFPLQRLFELEVLRSLDQGPAIGVHDILQDALKLTRQGDLTPEQGKKPKPKNKRQAAAARQLQRQLGKQANPNKRPKVAPTPLDFKAAPTESAKKTAQGSQLKRVFALMTHWVTLRKQHNAFVKREDCLFDTFCVDLTCTKHSHSQTATVQHAIKIEFLTSPTTQLLMPGVLVKNIRSQFAQYVNTLDDSTDAELTKWLAQ
jgi:hypothetical protein